MAVKEKSLFQPTGETPRLTTKLKRGTQNAEYNFILKRMAPYMRWGLWGKFYVTGLQAPISIGQTDSALCKPGGQWSGLNIGKVDMSQLKTVLIFSHTCFVKKERSSLHASLWVGHQLGFSNLL